MGKILKALKGVPLPPETKAEIIKLDRLLSNLEEFFEDQKTTVAEHAFLQQPAAEPKARIPFNEEQGTGERVQKSVVMGRCRY